MATKTTKKKTPRITKMDRLRMAAEATRPFGVRVVSGGRFEVEIGITPDVEIWDEEEDAILNTDEIEVRGIE